MRPRAAATSTNAARGLRPFPVVLRVTCVLALLVVTWIPVTEAVVSESLKYPSYVPFARRQRASPQIFRLASRFFYTNRVSSNETVFHSRVAGLSSAALRSTVIV